MGRHFLLANLEFHRRLVSWKSIQVKSLVFSDTGMVSGTLPGWDQSKWFQDIGCTIRLGILGKNILDFTFGFDLQNSIELDYHSIIWGASYKYLNYGAETPFTEYSVNSEGIFIEDTYQATDDLSIVLGIRADTHP